MPSIIKDKKYNYPADFLYNLVLDIESYPLFIPFCKKIHVINKNENSITAKMEVEFKIKNFEYISLINYSEKDYSIKVKGLKGPFDYLNNVWQFSNIDKNNCNMHFTIDFQLNSFLLNKTANLMLDTMVNKMIAAFETRASLIYK